MFIFPFRITTHGAYLKENAALPESKDETVAEAHGPRRRRAGRDARGRSIDDYLVPIALRDDSLRERVRNVRKDLLNSF